MLFLVVPSPATAAYSATDTLAMLTICRCWAVVIHRAVSKSFLLFCDFISIIQVAKCNDDGAEVERIASLMDELFHEWVTEFRREHGDERIIPKTHWLGHIGRLYRKYKVIHDIFVTERLNRRAKAMCSNIKNTTVFERSAVVGVLVSHMAAALSGDDIVGGGDVGHSCVSFGRRIAPGHFVRHKVSQAVGNVRCCFRDNADDTLTLIVGVRAQLLRPGLSASSYWTFAASSPHKFEGWTASKCSLAFGWKPFPSDILVLSPA